MAKEIKGQYVQTRLEYNLFDFVIHHHFGGNWKLFPSGLILCHCCEFVFNHRAVGLFYVMD